MIQSDIIFFASVGITITAVLIVSASVGAITVGLAIAGAMCVSAVAHRVWGNFALLREVTSPDMKLSSRLIDNTYILHIIFCITLPLSIITYYLLTSDNAAERNFAFVDGNPLGSLGALYPHMQSIADVRIKALFAKPLLPFLVSITYLMVALGGACICLPAIVRSWAARTKSEPQSTNMIRAVLFLAAPIIALQYVGRMLKSSCVSYTNVHYDYSVGSYIECVAAISSAPLFLLFVAISSGCLIGLWRHGQ